MASASFQLVRLLAVLALVCASAALATPKGRLPLALRGVLKVLGQDRGAAAAPVETVSAWRRALAFVLILVAAVLAFV